MDSFDVRFDGWVVLAAALCFAAFVYVLRFVKLGFSWARLAVFLLILWFILEPSIAVMPHSDGKPALAVLVDVSKSMGIKDSVTRLEEAQNLLGSLGEALNRRFKVSYYQFSDGVSRITEGGISDLKAAGSKTRIQQALEQVLYERKQENPAILLLSDGTRTDDEPREAQHFAQAVYSVGIGNESNLADISISGARGSDFAFKGRPVELSVTVRNSGYEGRTVPVLLKEIGEKSETDIGAEEVRFAKPAGETEVVFKFTPNSVGRLKYRVQVPAQKNEIAKLNNTYDFNLEVGREKLRVLYLCGQPSPEYYFLRQVLKSDPSIDLVSFVILRNPENVVPVPEDQLSLIPFPAHDIFVTTLSEFDLLIFENFSYSRFGIQPYHLENIRKFVEEKGGGFVMIGGENSFGRGNYAGSSLDSILPVQLDAGRETVEDIPVAMKVLDLQHPIFSTGESAPESARIWQSVPSLGGYHKLPGIKNGASLLAVNAEGGAPLIAGWKKGRGRVLALGIFSTWEWALGASEKGLLQSAYTQFWRQTVRWLTSLEDSKEIRIVLDQSQYWQGQTRNIQVLARTSGGNSADRTVTLTVSGDGRAPASLLLSPSGPQSYRAEWNPGTEGLYEMTAVLKEGFKTYSDRRSIRVEPVDQELENPYPNHEYLKTLSKNSGGKFYKPEELNVEALAGEVKENRTSGIEPVRKNLSFSPWLLAVAAGILIAEWALRRYRGEL